MRNLTLFIMMSAFALQAQAFQKSLSRYPIERSSLVGKKVLALTFDDGPNRTSTRDILETLKEYNVPATFFVLGSLAERNSDVMKEIYDDGHLLANHTYSHPALGKISFWSRKRTAKKEILKAHEILSPYYRSTDGLYFRAPENSWHKSLASYLNKQDELSKYVGPVMWDIGGSMNVKGNQITQAADWACWVSPYKLSPSECAQGYLNEIKRKKGGIVLLHDIHVSTAKMLKILLPKLKEMGYSFVTLNEVDSLKK